MWAYPILLLLSMQGSVSVAKGGCSGIAGAIAPAPESITPTKTTMLGTLKIVRSYAIANCWRKAIVAYSEDVFKTRDGQRYVAENNSGLRSTEFAERYFTDVTRNTEDFPSLNGIKADFVADAGYAAVRGKGLQTWLGVWNRPGRSEVAAMLSRRDGTKMPVPIFTSTRKIIDLQIRIGSVHGTDVIVSVLSRGEDGSVVATSMYWKPDPNIW